MRTPKNTTAVLCLSVAVIIAISVAKRPGSTVGQDKPETAGRAAKAPARERANRLFRDAPAFRRAAERGESRRVNDGEHQAAGRDARLEEAPRAEIFDAFERWTQEYISRKGGANSRLVQAGES